MRAVIDSTSRSPLSDWVRAYTAEKNFTGVVVGKVQSGKSTLSLSLGCSIDPGFNVDRVAFTATGFMSLVNSQERKRGDVIILEEAGVNVSRAEWYSFVNKAILYLTQTYGWKGLIVLLNLPTMTLLDSRVAKLLTGYIETIRMLKAERKVKFKFQTIETKKKIGIRGRELYYYRPVTHINNMRVLVDYFYSDYPPKPLLDEYFKRADEYKNALGESLEKESIHADVVAEPFNFERAVEDVLIKRGVKDFLKANNKWDIDRFSAVYNIGQQKAKVFVKYVEERMRKMGITKPLPEKERIIENTPAERKRKEEEISGAQWAPEQ